MTFVDPTKEQFGAFKALRREGPIHMLNLVRLRAHASYPDGRKATGRDAYRIYAQETAAILARHGGNIRWVGQFEHTLIGPPDEVWDLAFIVEYPNAEAFMGMVRDPAYREAVLHRQAAVEDSRLIRLAPQAPENGFGAALAPEK